MNFGEFYVLLKKLPGATDGLKEDLVWQFTGGRTRSLREMTINEYKRMCASMRESDQGLDPEMFRVEIKRRRSAVLYRLQKLGIDTTSWAHIDNFCMSKKIAGKRFAAISIDELVDLVPKLESMLRKSGKKKIDVPTGLVDMRGFSKN